MVRLVCWARLPVVLRAGYVHIRVREVWRAHRLASALALALAVVVCVVFWWLC
jgi:hypothetical protein